MMGITFSDMAEALYQLQQEYGYGYCPSEYIILEKAKELKNENLRR